MFTHSCQSVFGLEFLGEVQGVVDQTEASGLATSKVGAEAEDEDHIRGSLVHACDLLTDLGLADSGTAGMQHIHNLESCYDQITI